MPTPWGSLLSRSHETELLDGDAHDSGELRANLRELAMLNRLPGGARASLAGVRRLIDGAHEVAILDVGTGRADIPLAFRRHEPRWRVTGLDARPEVLAVARWFAADGVTLLAGDARALPLPDDSVDVAHASLLLHHLDPSDAVAALREMARVSRRGVVVNDLRRGPLPYVMTWITTMALARSRYTRHDGPASARRAYTLGELDRMLTDAGLRPVWRSPGWLPRVVTAAVHA